MKRLLGLCYGALIFLSYLLIKIYAGNLYLLYFSVACGILLMCILPFLKAPIPRPFYGVFIRGSMYAVTNFLMLAAQSKGTVSSSLAASLIGSMMVSLPTFVRPPYRFKNMLIVIFLFLGIILLIDQITLSYLALLSGVIQAITFASASRVMRVHQIPIRWNLAMGFGMVTVLGVMTSFVMPLGDINQLKIQNLVIVSGVIIASQVAFFQLYKNFSAETAGRYSLGRIPWGYCIDMMYSGRLAAVHTVFGVIFLSAGSFLRRERRSSER